MQTDRRLNMTAKKNLYCTKRFAEESGAPRKLWRSLNKLLRRDEDSQPSAAAVSRVADGFAQLFEKEVDAVRAGTAHCPLPTSFSTSSLSLPEQHEDVLRVLLSSPTKS